MVGWHLRLDGHEFEQALGVGDGQGSLVCSSPRGCEESEMTEQLNNNNNTSIHDNWKNHSFDYVDLCQQSDVSTF